MNFYSKKKKNDDFFSCRTTESYDEHEQKQIQK